MEFKNYLQVDALTICYRIPNEEIEYLKNQQNSKLLDFETFQLFFIDVRKNVYSFNIIYTSNEENKTFGKLYFDLDKKFEDDTIKLFIRLENETLYRKERNKIVDIEVALNLTFNNFTTLDIALDTTRNAVRLTYKLYKKFECILNGKLQKKDEAPRQRVKHSGDLFFKGGPFEADIKTYGEVRVKQMNAAHDKTKGATLLIYNKKVEVEDESHKYYILCQYHFPKYLYRIEVHLNNAQIKNYQQQNRSANLNPFTVFSPFSLYPLFFYYFRSLLRFRYKRTEIDWQWIFPIADIATGDIVTTLSENAD